MLIPFCSLGFHIPITQMLELGSPVGAAVSPESTVYQTFSFRGGASAASGASNVVTESQRQMRLTRPGKLHTFEVRTNSTPQPSDGDLTLRVRLNGTDTGIVIVIPADSESGVFVDHVNSVNNAAGDLLSFSLVNAATSGNSTGLLDWSILHEV